MLKREEMENAVMCKYGLENNISITFCEIVETWKSDKAVETMYNIAMNQYVNDYE